MSRLIAILVGICSIANLIFLLSTPVQIVLTVLSVLTMLFYGGKRSVRSYNDVGTRLFTFGFLIYFVSFLGSATILLVFLLHLT